MVLNAASSAKEMQAVLAPQLIGRPLEEPLEEVTDTLLTHAARK